MSLCETHPNGKSGWNAKGDSAVSESQVSQEDQGYMNVAEIPVIRARKPALISKPRTGLSALDCHIP